MKSGRCPVCHTDLHLDAILEDDAARELMSKVINLKYGIARHIVAYAGLFRPEKSNLSNSRALKLINEVLALYPESRVLADALSATVERIRAKRAKGDKAPLSNHSYLKTVYTTFKEQAAQSSNVEARAKEQKTGSDTDDAYLQDMYNRGVDVAPLLGGKGREWLKAKGLL